jgi:hypothetical protein
MLAALQRDTCAQEAEPQEAERCELVRPDERVIEDITRDDAREQDDHLDDDKNGRRNFNDPAKPFSAVVAQDGDEAASASS